MKARRLGLLGAAALVVSSLIVGIPATAQAATAPVVSVVATGLNNPRGLTFGPDHQLYVAEGGTGGSLSTNVGQCDQVPMVGPYKGGYTARISRLNVHTGGRQTVIDGLPSSQTIPMPAPLVSGVADVSFLGGKLYALIAGAGCSHGLVGTSNSLLRIGSDRSSSQVADLSAFVKANPVRNPDAADFEPDGTWYSMARAGHSFYAVEPNHQELDRITTSGHISRVVDFSQTFPGNTDWRGPTAIARHGESFYIGTLTPFPIVPGKAQVLKVDPESGRFTVFADGLTTVLGLAFDRHGSLYVLESSVAAGFPGPKLGQIVKISGHERTTVATNLTTPTAMTFGPDRNLYVSNNGFGAPAGAGEIVKVAVHTDGEDRDDSGGD
jgi:hypothetical protein